MMFRIKSLFPLFALLLLPLASASAYTAYPSLAAGSSNSGLTTGTLIGYTVLGTNGTTVIAARATTGIVDFGGGSYSVPAGISVPDGSTYYVKWDRSDTSTILGVGSTSASSYAYTLQTNQATMLTNQATLQNSVAANGTAIAAIPNASANATAVWAAGTRTITGGTITTYTGNTPQTGDSYPRLGAPAGASLSADIAATLTAINLRALASSLPTRFSLLAIDGSGRVTTANPANTIHIGP